MARRRTPLLSQDGEDGIIESIFECIGERAALLGSLGGAMQLGLVTPPS